MSSIGEFIRARRKLLGLSGRELARRIGTTSGAVSNWERGPMREPSKELLQPLAETLRVTVDDLLQARLQSPSTSLNLSDDESELLTLYRRQGTLERTLILRMLQGLVK